MLQKGDRAPEFRLPSDEGPELGLSDFRGKRVILYFYPKDNTSGCTTQACGLRDAHPAIEARGAVVLGVSPDPQSSHAEFRESFALNFPLLSDVDHRVAEAYGVWKEKSMYGRKYWGIERTTFVIDGNGLVEEVWRKVSPKGHAERVLGALDATD
jgi:peroxiredoxin Q/BCP